MQEGGEKGARIAYEKESDAGHGVKWSGKRECVTDAYARQGRNLAMVKVFFSDFFFRQRAGQKDADHVILLSQDEKKRLCQSS